MSTKTTDVQQDRNRASMALDQLRASEGWNVIRVLLKENIKFIEDTILNNEKGDPEAEKILKLKRIYLLKLIEMPEKLIKHYQQTPSIDKEFDPYE